MSKLTCNDCGAKFDRVRNRGPAPKYCDSCRVERQRQAQQRWWAKNPGLWKQYQQDRKASNGN